MEAVYWYNVTPKDDVSASTAPANVIYSYLARIKSIDVILPPGDAGPSSYKVGDSVWVKILHGKCTTQFGKGKMTGVYSTRQDPAASESNHSNRGQHGPRDTSEDEDIAESVPLR